MLLLLITAMWRHIRGKCHSSRLSTSIVVKLLWLSCRDLWWKIGDRFLELFGFQVCLHMIGWDCLMIYMGSIVLHVLIFEVYVILQCFIYLYIKFGHFWVTSYLKFTLYQELLNIGKYILFTRIAFIDFILLWHLLIDIALMVGRLMAWTFRLDYLCF